MDKRKAPIDNSTGGYQIPLDIPPASVIQYIR